MILLSIRNVSKCPMMYSSIIFSIVHRLLIGLYEPILYIGLSFFVFGGYSICLECLWKFFLEDDLRG